MPLLYMRKNAPALTPLLVLPRRPRLGDPGTLVPKHAGGSAGGGEG